MEHLQRQSTRSKNKQDQHQQATTRQATTSNKKQEQTRSTSTSNKPTSNYKQQQSMKKVSLYETFIYKNE